MSNLQPMRPLWADIQRMGPDEVLARLRDRSKRVGECLVWQARVSPRGYGNITIGGKDSRANRVMMTLQMRCDLPQGKIVCHSCDNPACIEPSHLWLGTSNDNHVDMRRKGRAPKMRGSDNIKAKLSEDLVRAIRRDSRANGEIAREVGVNVECIWKIRAGRSWKHVS